MNLLFNPVKEKSHPLRNEVLGAVISSLCGKEFLKGFYKTYSLVVKYSQNI